MRISDWSSDVCSSDLHRGRLGAVALETFLHRQADFAERRARARGFDRVCEQIGFDRLRRGGRLAQRVERALTRSEEHTSELQSLMRISYAVFCLKKKKYTQCKETTINPKAPNNTKRDTHNK